MREEESRNVRKYAGVESWLNKTSIIQFYRIDFTYFVIVRKFERFYIGIF